MPKTEICFIRNAKNRNLGIFRDTVGPISVVIGIDFYSYSMDRLAVSLFSKIRIICRFPPIPVALKTKKLMGICETLRILYEVQIIRAHIIP